MTLSDDERNPYKARHRSNPRAAGRRRRSPKRRRRVVQRRRDPYFHRRCWCCCSSFGWLLTHLLEDVTVVAERVADEDVVEDEEELRLRDLPNAHTHTVASPPSTTSVPQAHSTAHASRASARVEKGEGRGPARPSQNRAAVGGHGARCADIGWCFPWWRGSDGTTRAGVVVAAARAVPSLILRFSDCPLARFSHSHILTSSHSYVL